MGSSLEHLLTEGVISEVLARLQSGKEAEVYVVRFGGKVVAAKVYKDRAHRSFKNNSSYKEGRAIRNTRSQRAIDRGSKFGKAAGEEAWKSAEADALYKLYAAGVRVPTPVLFLDGVLLMELVLDADGNAARRVIDVDLSAAQANAAYHDMVSQLVRLLACDLIHGDLSPYNVLWAANGPTLIDFPQIVSASHNSSSERFFLRDAENILGHFARIDRSLQARRSDAWEIWRAYARRELTPEFLPTGRGANPAPAQPRSFTPPPRQPQRRQERSLGGDGGAGRSPQPQHAARSATHDGRHGSRGGSPRPEASPSPQRPSTPPPRQGSARAFGGPRRPANAPEIIVRPRFASAPSPAAASPSSAAPAQEVLRPDASNQTAGRSSSRPRHRPR